MANGALPVASTMPWQARVGVVGASLIIFAGIATAAFVWGSSELAAAVVGASIVMAKEATGYMFSSSASSDKKDDTLAANAAALATSTPTPNVPVPSTVL